jgi:hypothetical protein
MNRIKLPFFIRSLLTHFHDKITFKENNRSNENYTNKSYSLLFRDLK